MTMKKHLLILALILLCYGATAQNKSASIDYAQSAVTSAEKDDMAEYRKNVLRGTIGTYGRPPRDKSGRVDCQTLINELLDIKANTYHWLIGNGEQDFEDLKTFLPMATKAGLKVWVTLLPPSEARTRPLYCINYQLWAKELAELSLKEPNLIAWSIDDFGHNQEFYNAYYINLVVPEARRINPKLAFIPCVYYGQSNDAFVKKYLPYMDGVLFPYRNESVKADLQTTSTAIPEMNKMKELYGDIPMILDVYASGHSRLGQCSTEYIDQVVDAGMKTADGVLIFCHQDPVKYPEKYEVLKKHFAKGWRR